MPAHVFISGFVQSVGYRHFVKKLALDLGLKGWVKNLPDSRVEALFTGNKENIEQAIELCKKGPFLSEVENVDVGIVTEEKFNSFEVIR